LSRMARVVFLGTPQFGVPVLEALARQHQVVAVVTQPDRSGGRGKAQLYVPAVKQVAVAHGLKIMQPASLRRDREAIEFLRQADADLFVLAAFGQILRPEVLAIPRHGCIGVHASLLPRLRGAAPIARAILSGEECTGVTLMLTDPGMDTGPIIAQQAIVIAPDDTADSLTTRLAALGANLVIETIPAWLAGAIVPRPQDDTQATLAPPIAKAEGAIDWQRPAVELDRIVRAFTPWPGAFSHYAGKVLKLIRVRPLPEWRGDLPVGTVLDVSGGVAVVTAKGLLILDTVQLEGRKALEARQFARGQRGFVGSLLH
jgi:methionyl-tRNA formyltransferase